MTEVVWARHPNGTVAHGYYLGWYLLCRRSQTDAKPDVVDLMDGDPADWPVPKCRHCLDQLARLGVAEDT